MHVPPSDHVLARRQGRVGRILLDRPRALNALDPGMIGAVAAALDAWREEPEVHAVVVEGAGGRAFCAGGDVRAVREAVIAGRHAEIERFFEAEYGLNQAIASYPKPYVALIDGICMGGGIGLSVHGSAQIVTEAATLAMPETGIGLFPDIGATYVLPRLRGAFGMWMALTGAQVSGADAAYLGLATHFTSRERLATLGDELAEHGVAALAAAAIPPPAGAMPAHAEAITRCFSADSVTDILARLQQEDTDWSRETTATLRQRSPTALSWTFRIVRDGARRTLPQCLAAELALMTRHATRHPDFVEGVRAAVVDKDRAPRWSPPRLEDVRPESIQAAFA